MRRADPARRRRSAHGARRHRGGAEEAAQGAGLGRRARSISRPATARVFDAAEQAAKKAGDGYVTVERLLLALALEKDSEAGKILAKADATPQKINAAIEALRKGRTADSADRRERL